MERHQSISEVVERAKQQRADYIGAAISKHPIAALLVVAIPFVLTQLQWSSSAPVATDRAIQSEVIASSVAPTQLQPQSDGSLVFSSIEKSGTGPAR